MEFNDLKYGALFRLRKNGPVYIKDSYYNAVVLEGKNQGMCKYPIYAGNKIYPVTKILVRSK